MFACTWFLPGLKAEMKDREKMFTGIVRAQGRVLELKENLDSRGQVESALLTLEADSLLEDLETGGSLAVDGVCLTALDSADHARGIFRAYLMGETLRRTSLGSLKPGSLVNLERCLAVGERLDGHLVQGHVDGLGTLVAMTQQEAWRTYRFAIPADLAPFLAEKGSITVSGVSLTVTAVSDPAEAEPWFEVGLIPATLEATNLGGVQLGDRVNLETDSVAKYLHRFQAFQGVGAVSVLAGQEPSEPAFSSIDQALEALREGRPLVVVDDEDRENEGDLIFAAEHATDQLMGFTIRYTSGVICAPMSQERAQALGLPPMTLDNQDAKGTAYTLSCDARVGVSTGISAADRALTARLLASDQTGPDDLTRPGHLFPLTAQPGGVRQRPGHTEAAVDLTRLAGLSGVGVIAELVHDDGSMMRLPALADFAREHDLPLISIADLVVYLQEAEGE